MVSGIEPSKAATTKYTNSVNCDDPVALGANHVLLQQ